MKILDYNHCTNAVCSHYPNCEWNLKISGISQEELYALKEYLKDKITIDLIEYEKKIQNRLRR